MLKKNLMVTVMEKRLQEWFSDASGKQLLMSNESCLFCVLQLVGHMESLIEAAHNKFNMWQIRRMNKKS